MNIQEVIDAVNEEWDSKLRKMVIEIVTESFPADEDDSTAIVYLHDVLDIILKYQYSNTQNNLEELLDR